MTAAESIAELQAILIEARNYIRNLPSQPQAAFKQIDARIGAVLAKHPHGDREPTSQSIEDLREALAPFASGYNLFYRNEPDDRLLSLGHWSETESDSDPLPKFYGDVALNVGMVRRAYQLLHPPVEDEA